MATTTLPNNPTATAPAESRTVARSWLIGPKFDLLFVVNCLWPIAFLVGFQSDLAAHSSLQFWQIYFVTTPHRWMTLLLVMGDPARFGERPRTFVTIAVAIVGGCLLVQLSTGALTCLLVVDYLWNAWHFAAQHHGIYRVYERKSDRNAGANSGFKWTLRLSLLYVIFRVAGGTWQFDELERGLFYSDFAMAGLLIAMLGREWLLNSRSFARSAYFTSVVLLYLSLLAAVHFQRPDMVLVLSTASALFHATEYLAIVGWNVQMRGERRQSRGLMRDVAKSWIAFLILFAISLGIAGWYADRYWLKVWNAVNVMMAFVHYAYDGLIWKQRAPAR